MGAAGLDASALVKASNGLMGRTTSLVEAIVPRRARGLAATQQMAMGWFIQSTVLNRSWRFPGKAGAVREPGAQTSVQAAICCSAVMRGPERSNIAQPHKPMA